MTDTSEQHVDDLVAKRVCRQWCLFLDRDGVANRQIVGDYVRSWEDFEWLPGAPSALRRLRQWAPYVVFVTNQQGIGKGLMTPGQVAEIHQHMQDDLAADSVSVDGFQVCPHLESASCACRKPRSGLVLDWLRQHPDVEPSLSVMVGDSPSDIQLAHNVAAVTGGCAGILIGGRASLIGEPVASFNTLWDFAVAVGNSREEQNS